jgi:hypothetical protein
MFRFAEECSLYDFHIRDAHSFASKSSHFRLGTTAVILPHSAVRADDTVARHASVVVVCHESTHGACSAWVSRCISDIAIRHHLPFRDAFHYVLHSFFEVRGLHDVRSFVALCRAWSFFPAAFRYAQYSQVFADSGRSSESRQDLICASVGSIQVVSPSHGTTVT